MQCFLSPWLKSSIAICPEECQECEREGHTKCLPAVVAQHTKAGFCSFPHCHHSTASPTIPSQLLKTESRRRMARCRGDLASCWMAHVWASRKIWLVIFATRICKKSLREVTLTPFWRGKSLWRLPESWNKVNTVPIKLKLGALSEASGELLRNPSGRQGWWVSHLPESSSGGPDSQRHAVSVSTAERWGESIWRHPRSQLLCVVARICEFSRTSVEIECTEPTLCLNPCGLIKGQCHGWLETRFLDEG